MNYDLLIEIINELDEYPEYSINDILYFLNIQHTKANYDIEIFAEHIDNFKTLIGRTDDYCSPFDCLYISTYYKNTTGDVLKIQNTFSNNSE